MTLNLNLPNEYIRIDGHEILHFREYEGRTVDQLQKLLADGRVPMSTA